MMEQQRKLYESQINSLQNQVNSLKPTAQAKPAPSDPATTDQDAQPILNPRYNIPAAGETRMEQTWSPTDPIRFARGNAFVDLGLTATLAVGGSTADDLSELNAGGHDPNQRGFSHQGLELNIQGAVDPYSRGNANILFQLQNDGDTLLEVEEAWLESTSLPANLQLRAGQYFSSFGRQNPTHLHAWAFVDQPLAVSRLMGPDGMRNPGAQLSWLAPTPFYTELFFGAQNSGGGTASSFRGNGGHHHGGEEEEEEEVPMGFRHADNDRGIRSLSDMLYTTRLASSFDLSDTMTLLVGGSGAFGPNNSGEAGETRTTLYGADLTWKWRSRKHQRGFPFVQLQSEFIARDFETGSFDWDEGANGGDGDGNGFVDGGVLTDPLTGLPATLAPETLSDYGLYTQLTYGFKPGWVAGMRFDYLWGQRASYEVRGLGLADNAGGIDAVGIDLERGSRYRLSPNLTWFPTEFSKIRLQYNYDHRERIGVDHSLWLQLEMSLGAHAAHQF